MKFKVKFSLWLSILKTKKSMPLVEVKINKTDSIWAGSWAARPLEAQG